MYNSILNCIEALNIKGEDRKIILKENCIRYVFSWNPFKIKNSEYYKRFIDWTYLKNYENRGENKSEQKDVNNLIKRMKSEFYRKEFANKKYADGDINVYGKKFNNDDMEIVLAMIIISNQVWQNRISALWTGIVAILSLFVAFFSISITFQK